MAALKKALLLLILLRLPGAMAQDPVGLNSVKQDPMVVLYPKGVEVSQPGFVIHKYVGNVKVRHQGVLLFCDQVIRNGTTNRIDGYGHVLLVQGDSITIRGDTLVYDGNDRHATLRGRVMFQHRRVLVTTTQLDYFLASGMAHYATKSRLVNGKSVLVSQAGSYNNKTRQFTAQPAVQLASTGNTLRSMVVAQEGASQLMATMRPNPAVGPNSGDSVRDREQPAKIDLVRSEGKPTVEPAKSPATGEVGYQNAALASGVATVGAVSVAKAESARRPVTPDVATGIKRSATKAWTFDKPVVAPVAPLTKSTESVVLKKTEIDNETRAAVSTRPAAVSGSKRSPVSQKAVVLPAKPPVAEPVESDLERELNGSQHSKYRPKPRV